MILNIELLREFKATKTDAQFNIHSIYIYTQKPIYSVCIDFIPRINSWNEWNEDDDSESKLLKIRQSIASRYICS